MASVKVLDVICGLEELARTVPFELRKDEVLRRRLYDAVQMLVPEVETPVEMSQRLFYAPCEMTAAKLGVDLNLFEILATSPKPLTTVDLAIATCVEPDMLLRLLKFIASIGLIKELQANLWGPSNATRNLTDRNIAAGVNHKHDNVMPAWHALPSWLNRRDYKPPTTTTDTPFAQGHGIPLETTFFAWLKEHPWNANEFNLFMNVHRTGVKTWLDRPEVVELFREDSASRYSNGSGASKNGYVEKEKIKYTFVDIGGGIGQQCKDLQSRLQFLKGKIVLQDLPAVVAKADINVTWQIEAMAVDFFDCQPIKGATVYYLRSILRNWPDPQCHTILSHIHNAMSPTSYLLIDEIVLADYAATKAETQLDMTMMSMLNGQARTETHFRALLAEAGFGVLDVLVYQEEGREAVVVARKMDVGGTVR